MFEADFIETWTLYHCFSDGSSNLTQMDLKRTSIKTKCVWYIENYEGWKHVVSCLNSTIWNREYANYIMLKSFRKLQCQWITQIFFLFGTCHWIIDNLKQYKHQRVSLVFYDIKSTCVIRYQHTSVSFCLSLSMRKSSFYFVL